MEGGSVILLQQCWEVHTEIAPQTRPIIKLKQGYR